MGRGGEKVSGKMWKLEIEWKEYNESTKFVNAIVVIVFAKIAVITVYRTFLNKCKLLKMNRYEHF